MRKQVLAVPVLMVVFGVLGGYWCPAVFAGGVQWSVSAFSTPTHINPGASPGEDSYTVLLMNTGSEESGSPVTVSDELPAGLSLDPVGASGESLFGLGRTGFSCVLASCTFAPNVAVDRTLVFTFPVDVSAADGADLRNVVRVSGGGGDSVSLSIPTTVSARPASFGIPEGSASTALSSLQAGAHPDITTAFAFDSINAKGTPAADVKDVVYRLPPGFASDFAETPQCSPAEFLKLECPVTSQIGVTTVEILLAGKLDRGVEPVYNLVPGQGHLGALGFSVAGQFEVQGEISLEPRSYGAEVMFANVDDLATVVGSSLTVWGLPSSHVHDALRLVSGPQGPAFGGSSSANPTPYFINPSSCGSVPLESEFQVDSWEEPGAYVSTRMPFGPIRDCDRLPLEPVMEVQPSTSSAESPTGLNVHMQFPQHYENVTGVAASELDNATVTLPEGMTVNPSAGAGLAGCTPTQFQYEGGSTEPQPGLGCPAESKLGSAHAASPGIPGHEEVNGSLFLATPYENPFAEPPEHPNGTLLAVYLVLRNAARGIVVTAAGKVHADPVTGQLTTTFAENPQLPVSGLTFVFHQGTTSPLVTPPVCGTFETRGVLTPWSAPTQEHVLSSLFEITSGAGGGPCPAGSVPPLRPQVVSYPIHPNAGRFSPFYLQISRNDGEQEITGFSTQLPEGLTADLDGVPFCGEAEIALAREKTGAQELASPSCPAASQIGHTIAEAGVGTVLAQATGKLYFGGPFQGAPFSLVSITAAKVGPFDLGTVVVHLPLQIDPVTAQVTIPAGPAGQIPHIIKGIVIHVRGIRVFVDRENFMLNPTSCQPLSLAATVIGSGANPANPAEELPVLASDPFQVADCSNLSFTPKLTVTTGAHASKANGAELKFKISYPPDAIGHQTWLNEAKFDIPKQLPARLSTLQQACLAATFEHDRPACPPASIIGHAIVHTPILPEPLTGPVYFVSYGGAKFPDAVIVLHGYGVTIESRGETFINHKTGITSATFTNIPDVPFQTIEVTLPAGPYSEFGANLPPKAHYNFCNQKLTMPTLLKASNNTQTHQNTPVTPTNCPKKPHKHK